MLMNSTNNITERQYSEVREYFERLATNHPKMNYKKVLTMCDKKEERYRDYIENDLVRVEQYGHALFSEWIPRDDAKGLEIHDPKVWIEEREKRKGKLKC